MDAEKELDDLARSMALNVDKVWVRTPQGEVLVPLTRVHAGDEVVVRSGNMIPLDGMVLEGEAMVNQAALTGESMPVRKAAGATVYAGTVVEEGECVLVAKAEGGANRYDKIVAMIEESEKLKSGTENRALQLADRLVPWCLAGTVAYLRLDPQRHPRHLHPDGGLFLRIETLHAACGALCHAGVRGIPHHRKGRQVSGSAGAGGHHRV